MTKGKPMTREDKIEIIYNEIKNLNIAKERITEDLANNPTEEELEKQ